MTNKQLVLYALERYKGHEAEDLRREYRGLSPDRMSLPDHRRGGRLRSHLLIEAEDHERIVQEAIDWVEAGLPETTASYSVSYQCGDMGTVITVQTMEELMQIAGAGK